MGRNNYLTMHSVLISDYSFETAKESEDTLRSVCIETKTDTKASILLTSEDLLQSFDYHFVRKAWKRRDNLWWFIQFRFTLIILIFFKYAFFFIAKKDSNKVVTQDKEVINFRRGEEGGSNAGMWLPVKSKPYIWTFLWFFYTTMVEELASSRYSFAILYIRVKYYTQIERSKIKFVKHFRKRGRLLFLPHCQSSCSFFHLLSSLIWKKRHCSE